MNYVNASAITTKPSRQQMAAITAPIDRAVRVLAGPGAGKTSVIARRYQFLVESGVRPEQILAVTFSRDMAQELQERIVRINPSIAYNKAALDQICTIHAACNRILRWSGDQRRRAQDWMVHRAIRTAAVDQWPDARQRPSLHELEVWVNQSKSAGYGLGWDGDQPDLGDILHLQGYFARRLRQGTDAAARVAAVRVALDRELRSGQLLTFGDMLLDVEVRLTRDARFRERWQRHFGWIILDEAQDASGQAIRILSGLAQPENRMFSVGDGDQMLFRWAGADPEHGLYRGFEELFPDSLVVKLSMNYRSAVDIVSAQMRLIRNNYRRLGGLIPMSYLKQPRFWRNAPAGYPVTFTLYNTQAAEAAGVATAIRDAIANGARQAQDFFIGARTRAQLAHIECALAAEGLLYVNVAGRSFWCLEHVQDVMAYLALACDRSDRAAFERVRNIPSRALGAYSRGLDRGFMTACGGEWSGLDRAVMANARWGYGVRDLREFVERLETVLTNDGPAAGIRHVLFESYEPYLRRAGNGLTGGQPPLEGDSAAADRIGELETLAEIARSYQDGAQLVDYARRMGAAAAPADQSQRIVISTIHRLKGKERKVMYGIGWSEGVDSKGEPVGLLPHTNALRSDLPTAVPDERCLAFVLLSRAREDCHLSGIRRYHGWQMEPSRFVSEAGVAVMING